MVLSRETGLMSPQFHVAFDPTFDTVKDIQTKSLWQASESWIHCSEGATHGDKTASNKNKTCRANEGG